nr:integrase, catalytic region, zinc finger, CCHC-type, peptidase aspartic, catalytic [Tanacetum cinerariifolium]
AVATACYTQNRSIIRLRHGKTPYELLHNKLPDLSFFHVFGALCYPTNDNENLGKLQPKANIGIFIGYAPTKKAFRIYNRRTRRIVETIHVDFDELTAMASEQSSSLPDLSFFYVIFIGYAPTKKAFRIYNRRTRRIVETIHVDFDELTAMASKHHSSGPALNKITPGTISSGLMHTSSPSTSYVPPSQNDWDLLFQPMFDELLNAPPSVVNQTPEAIAPIAEVIPPGYVDLTNSPSSTTVKQDAPSTSNSPTPTDTQS